MSTEGTSEVEAAAAAHDVVARLTAVLIDDMSEIRMLLRMALEDVGIEVVGEAADGAAGVEVAAACQPDIVILDVSMPVMDGLTALPRIRDTLPDAKIIMLSAFDRELCEEPALARGADAYVEKGQVDQLIKTVLELGGRPEPCPSQPRERNLPTPRGETPMLRVVPVPAEAAANEPADAHQRSAAALQGEWDAARASLDQLAHMVSRDLAEPINLIVGVADRLSQRWSDADPKDQEYLGYVTAAAHRAQAMLDDVCAYVQGATHDLTVEHVDCAQVMEDVRASLTVPLRESGARLRSDLLPVDVVADRFVLTQVLTNLVANAITFTAPGIAPEIAVSASGETGTWTFTVTDNGIGIAPEDIERVFLPFKRLHGSADDGNGIGLAVCRQLVTRHGGRIDVRSSDGRGTVVAFTLPHRESTAQGCEP